MYDLIRAIVITTRVQSPRGLFTAFVPSKIRSKLDELGRHSFDTSEAIAHEAAPSYRLILPERERARLHSNIAKVVLPPGTRPSRNCQKGTSTAATVRVNVIRMRTYTCR